MINLKQTNKHVYIQINLYSYALNPSSYLLCFSCSYIIDGHPYTRNRSCITDGCPLYYRCPYIMDGRPLLQLSLYNGRLSFTTVNCPYVIDGSPFLFCSIKVGAMVAGITAVLVIAILIIYIIKANYKRSRVINVSPVVSKIHYSHRQSNRQVTVLHVTNGDVGHPSM